MQKMKKEENRRERQGHGGRRERGRVVGGRRGGEEKREEIQTYQVPQTLLSPSWYPANVCKHVESLLPHTPLRSVAHTPCACYWHVDPHKGEASRTCVLRPLLLLLPKRTRPVAREKGAKCTVKRRIIERVRVLRACVQTLPHLQEMRLSYVRMPTVVSCFVDFQL